MPIRAAGGEPFWAALAESPVRIGRAKEDGYFHGSIENPFEVGESQPGFQRKLKVVRLLIAAYQGFPRSFCASGDRREE